MTSSLKLISKTLGFASIASSYFLLNKQYKQTPFNRAYAWINEEERKYMKGIPTNIYVWGEG